MSKPFSSISPATTRKGFEAVKKVWNSIKNTAAKAAESTNKAVKKGAKAVVKALYNASYAMLMTKKPSGKDLKKEQRDNGLISEPSNHKYIARIKMPNGKYRYFYDTKSLENYYKTHPEAKPKGFDKFELKNSAATPEEDMAAVNPNYSPGANGYYENNCYACTLTYEARRRGYDVEALPDINGATLADISKMYQTSDGKPVDDLWVQNRPSGSSIATALVFEDYIKKEYGEGARGQLCVRWAGGGGHSMVWEVTDGQVIVRDCQTNKKHELMDILSRVSVDMPGGVNILRTDDKEFTDETSKYLRNDQTKED